MKDNSSTSGICRSLISYWLVYVTFNLLAVRNQMPNDQLLFSSMDLGSLPQEKWAPRSAYSISPLSISMA